MRTTRGDIEAVAEHYWLYLMYNEYSNFIKIGMCVMRNIEKRREMHSKKLIAKLNRNYYQPRRGRDGRIMCEDMKIVKKIQITDYISTVRLEHVLKKEFKRSCAQIDMTGSGYKSKEWFVNSSNMSSKQLGEYFENIIHSHTIPG
jgi:hypothetical protein